MALDFRSHREVKIAVKIRVHSQISQVDRGWHNDGLINNNGQILIDKRLGLVREGSPFVMNQEIFIERQLGEAQAKLGLIDCAYASGLFHADGLDQRNFCDCSAMVLPPR